MTAVHAWQCCNDIERFTAQARRCLLGSISRSTSSTVIHFGVIIGKTSSYRLKSVVSRVDTQHDAQLHVVLMSSVKRALGIQSYTFTALGTR